MILQVTLFCLILLIAPRLPLILTSVTYSIASILLVQNVNPRLIFSLFVIFRTVSIVILRFFVWYVFTKIQAYQRKRNYTDWISRILDRIKPYIKVKNNKHRTNLKNHLTSDKGQLTLFVLAVVGFTPTIPDLLTVILLKKRLKLPYFILAAFIWKSIEFFPFIFLGKTIISYFKL